MSFLKQLKEQVQADIEHVLDRNDKPFQTDDGKYEAESKKLDKQLKLWKQSIEKQRKLERYFYQEWQDAKKMANKRAEQLEIAENAGVEELVAQAQSELASYQELASEYSDSYEEQKERVKKLEARGRELEFLRKKIRRMQLDYIARTEEAKLEKNAAKWTYYAEENGDLDGYEEDENEQTEKSEAALLKKQPSFDVQIEELKQQLDKKSDVAP